MDDEIRKALAEMPEKGRSKLEPHADVIRELRRKGQTYEEIARFFSERFSLKVAPSTIFAFVRVRARRHGRLRIELPPTEASPPPTVAALANDANIRKRIEEVKRRQPIRPEQPKFHYDENKPLELIGNGSEKISN